MEREKQVAVVTDSGCSMRPEFPEVRKLGITVTPLEVRFFENGNYIPYSDLGITPSQFYEKMQASTQPLQTAGAVPGTLLETFKKLSQKANSIISINLTSKHSGVWQSAVDAKNVLKDEIPEIEVGVIDSKQISLGQWFLAKAAKQLSDMGVGYDEIMASINEKIPKTELRIVLETLKNIRLGGRADEILNKIARMASYLPVKPIFGLKDGALTLVGQARTTNLARKNMIEMVGDAGKLVRLAVVHTNAPNLAEKIKEALGKIYKGTIPVYEAGPVLAVHAGEGAIGIAFQKA